jgi:hypothetical protein
MMVIDVSFVTAIANIEVLYVRSSSKDYLELRSDLGCQGLLCSNYRSLERNLRP